MRKIKSSLHGWSLANLVYPVLKDGEFVWGSDFMGGESDGLILGTREDYLEWVSKNGYQNPMSRLYFYPLGIILCRDSDGHIQHGSAHTEHSSCCSSKNDFYPLFLALEGLDADRKTIGTGVYLTYTKYFGIPMPKYFIHKDEKHEEENNFLQKYLV